MATVDPEVRTSELGRRFGEVREHTEKLAAPLSPEDQMVQSMPDVSPTKWHRGHTTWFFETFILPLQHDEYSVFHPAFGYIFNSYYEAVGSRQPRDQRGVISRPSVGEVADYRGHVDKMMGELLFASRPPSNVLDLVELGLNHEQQHQELLLMDIKHVLWCNPLMPAYCADERLATAVSNRLGWVEHDGGTVELGHRGEGFGFDNEFPLHQALLTPFAVADRLVTCGEWLEFMADGGYRRPELWLSDGWATVNQQDWEAPLYWSKDGEAWQVFSLCGPREVNPSEPVCHVSYYEADAYAHWTGLRLPTEPEWEAIAAEHRCETATHLHPFGNDTSMGDLFGEVWQWTASAYCPYPGFRAAPGAVGEYNGKFMVNQHVLRGGACVTPDGHTRATYRNFFHPASRWAFSGLRLARDL
ncbi:MAG: ergothioneine biosynthesis protein EgtB [Acidimicrobiales bacterium]